MSLGHGASVVRNGLVFHYDMSNDKKSWKGKPTTNLFSNPTNLASGWTTNNTSYNSSTQKAYITSNSSGNYFLQDRSLTSGLEYSISLEVKAIESYIIQLTPSTGFTIADYANINLIDGSISGTATGISKANSFYLGKGWWRVSYTETATSTGSGRIAFAIGDDENYTRLSSASGLNVNDGLFIRAAQFEQNSFATPFVNGTRSNTEAILDLTKTHTLNAVSITYQSDNTFEFGAGYLQTNYTQSNPNFYTAEAVVKLNSHSTDSNIGYQLIIPYQSYNAWIFSLCGPNSRLQLRNHNADTSSNAYNLKAADGLNLNQYYHCVGVDDGSTVRLYINGEQVTSMASATATTNGTMQLEIGGWPGVAFTLLDGEIPEARIYHRALSANEVKQNFNATRGRYGI